MGKRLVLTGIFFIALYVGPAWAQPEEAAESSGVLEQTKAFIERLDPIPEYVVFASVKDLGDANFSSFEQSAGISGAIYKNYSGETELWSIRLGGQFEGDRKLYTTLGLNGIGLAQRYLPDGLKDALSPGFVAGIWSALGTYGHVSAGVGLKNPQDLFSDGYTFEDSFGVIGTVGIRIPL